ncbi:phage tail tape measure protein [Vibrio parahaemolyticus]|uniref:phage tail tape measure protein n=1 Tax=Vibrio parahaemolyticus TaxID=670 RepID=UPI00111E1E10|nr:phage tail tape measure protein [Vibrio parahaemolyticus]MQC79140.1 phage tail tape measure protein [Vibrio parahaemolyticus]MQC90970.1 phage tail tape measure protein [Vibrio parahaemolyticus]MQD10383.1 phage tail tape measure protein [Vibrio parahaemolyticus]MQE59620.1 phage tail tape measure protein [Vibrio parahaemolyticus]TPB67935.1 phage tail tape measure protein [Vibrio parahaemolyticus]
MLPEALRFTVGLVDQISKPLGNIQRNLTDVANTYRDGTHTMVAGAAGVAGAGFALQSALMPAIEMDRALGEVKSLGVADDALKAIAKTALNFSAEYGQSAIEVIRHSEGIKNAMGEMPADVMASVTRSSATLAVAMKSDAETTTRFLKNLYGNYKTQADAMGVDVWAAKIAGMTATAKQLYGVEMDAIEGMVDGMHSLTSTLGVSLEEQFAVFGMLKGQMSDGDAVTQYTNFLENAVSAQDKLGVSLVGSNGQLLPMQQVLKNLAPLLEGLSGTEARTLLDEAGLGDGALMLTNLVNRADEFGSSLDALKQVKGLDAASDMAATMTDQWQRMEQGMFAIRAAIGSALLPSLVPLLSSLADGAQEIVEWTQLFPNITKWIGYAGITLLSFVAINGLLTMAVGIGKQAMASYILVTKGYGLAVAGVNSILKAFKVAMLAANIAMMANPIGLVVGAVVAAIAAVGALIYYWDDLKASFGDTTWFQIIESALALIMLPFQTLFQFLKAGWQWVMSGFTDTSGFAFIGDMANSMKDMFAGVFNWITESLAGIWESVKGLVDWIPGLGSDEDLQVKSSSMNNASPRLQVQPGGAAKNIANYQTSSTNYGGVSIYPTYMSSPQDMATELEMAAG